MKPKDAKGKEHRKWIERIFLIITFLFILSSTAFTIEIEDVKNFTYNLSFYGEKITLKNGVFSKYNPPNEIVEVFIERYKLVDLNDDGIEDAIVILVGNYGGSGSFYELTVLLSKGKDIVQTNSVVLGDRIKIEKIFIQPGLPPLLGSPYPEIAIFAITHKDSDASALPSKKDVICYALVEENLIPCREIKIPVVKKPALYLYPKKEQTIKVTLSPKGYIIDSIPPYRNKWIVKVAPSGKINNQYDYLFYEVKLKKPYILSDIGWVVPYRDLSKWFDFYLPKFGLNKKEAQDFKSYWLEKLKPYEYYEIRHIDEKFLKENLHVNIDPKPDTFIRVFLHFKGTDFKGTLTEPQIIKKDRKGFTAVEWGGISAEEEFTPNTHSKDFLKKELIKTTIKAIEMEIKRYESTNHPDKKAKIDYLESELKKFRELSPNSYKLENELRNAPLSDFSKFGPLMPPVEREVFILIDEPTEESTKDGAMLKVEGMSKSGPFYHLAGINENIVKELKAGRYKVKIYLLYKREYFGSISNYYVYIADIIR